eukprot:7916238-Pyramimonas_sp.AAC.1
MSTPHQQRDYAAGPNVARRRNSLPSSSLRCSPTVPLSSPHPCSPLTLQHHPARSSFDLV